jgi:hypothetical protein
VPVFSSAVFDPTVFETDSNGPETFIQEAPGIPSEEAFETDAEFVGETGTVPVFSSAVFNPNVFETDGSGLEVFRQEAPGIPSEEAFETDAEFVDETLRQEAPGIPSEEAFETPAVQFTLALAVPGAGIASGEGPGGGSLQEGTGTPGSPAILTQVVSIRSAEAFGRPQLSVQTPGLEPEDPPVIEPVEYGTALPVAILLNCAQQSAYPLVNPCGSKDCS